MHCIFVEKLLNICSIYFVTVSQCPQRPLLTTVFRQNAAGGCVCVKGLQCGSPSAMRTRDPPIIQVEIPSMIILDPDHDELKVSDPNLQHGVKYINLSQVLMLF